MPRDGSGVYNAPPGTHGVPDTTIGSAQYNDFVDDVAQDLNHPRPVVAGGTGATNAADALTALGGENAHQLVTNFDSDPLVAGSFHSPTTATNPPVAAHAFAGIVYAIDTNNMVVEARDESDTAVPGRKYVREMKAGVWGPWKNDGRTVIGTSEGIGGDTANMFFGVTGTDPNSAFIVNSKADASGANIFSVWKSNRVVVHLGTDENFAISDAGGNIGLAAINDAANAYVGAVLSASTLVINGSVSFATSPVAPTPPITDNSTLLATTEFVKSQPSNFLPLTGGTVSGNLLATGYLAAGAVVSSGAGDISSVRGGSPGQGIIFLGNSGARYLLYDGSNYTLSGAHLFTAAGRVWGSNDFSSPVSNGRLAFAADYQTLSNSPMAEPYSGAVITGSRPEGVVRYRYMQLFTSSWFTVGYV
jgi:hypothetical protein